MCRVALAGGGVAREVDRERVQRRVCGAWRGRARDQAAADAARELALWGDGEYPSTAKQAGTPVCALDQARACGVEVQAAVRELDRHHRAGRSGRLHRVGVIAADAVGAADLAAVRCRATQRQARGKFAVLDRVVRDASGQHCRDVDIQAPVKRIKARCARGLACHVELAPGAQRAGIDVAHHLPLRSAGAHRALPHAAGVLLYARGGAHVFAVGRAAAATGEQGRTGQG